jgi:uncharacterized protein GlcG (DUF336 family)
MNRRVAGAALFCAGLSTSVHAQDATFSVRLMTLETALEAARAALASCRKSGYQVAVAVVDRGGLPQVLLRDRYAGAHTADMALDKAWTAASFRVSTSEIARATAAGKPLSGLRERPRVAAVGGGVVIESAGTLLGAIGVSGAPGGDADDACAIAGAASIQTRLDF